MGEALIIPGPQGLTGPEGAPGPQGVPGNIELGYAETNVLQQVTGANSNVDTAIVPLVTTVTVAARPISIQVQGTIQPGAANLQGYVTVYEGAVKVAEWQVFLGETAFGLIMFNRVKRLSPAAGVHTYQVKLRTGATNQTVALPANGDHSIAVLER